MSRDANDEIRTTLHELEAHLTGWGLRHFTGDEAYFQWQRQVLSPQALSALHDHVAKKRQGSTADEIAFYDLTADPRILPVLYSQRYEYYLAIGPLVAAHIDKVGTILDFGCGIGILTTFYAKQFPHAQVVGVDRSPASIAQAKLKAKEFNVANVRFECVDGETEHIAGNYALIVATHALVQSEQNPGLPSRNWRTFERAHDQRQQSEFERRTGIGVRLDSLTAALAPTGRMIVFEKTRQPARRIPLQRAFSAHGLHLLEPPKPVRYSLVEEVSDDGPFYVLTKGQGSEIDWDEQPETDEGLPFDRADVKCTPHDHDAPLYENHWPSAQREWERLNNRKVSHETTNQEADGRQMHVELGTTEGLCYLYCANTFDQRQLVIVEPARASLLDGYYREIVGG